MKFSFFFFLSSTIGNFYQNAIYCHTSKASACTSIGWTSTTCNVVPKAKTIDICHITLGKVKEREWPKLVYLSNVITWRGFGNTNKKKNTKTEKGSGESGDGQMKRRRRRRRRRRRETAGSSRRFGVTGNRCRKWRRDRRLVLGAASA